MLYAKLLTHSTAEDADLLMLLREHHMETQPSTKSDINEVLSEVRNLKERVRF